jgi:hypothetical protein
MKEKGWLYCSGMISDCPPGKPISKRYPDSSFSEWQYYSCRQRIKDSHWHKIYETEDSKTIVDWDVIYEEPDSKKEIFPEGGRSFSDPEIAERKYCADHHLCMSCKKPLKGEWGGDDYHTGYWIPRCHGYYWCTECWDKEYKGHHTWCPHNKDPHRLDAYNESNRKWNERNRKSNESGSKPE